MKEHGSTDYDDCIENNRSVEGLESCYYMEVPGETDPKTLYSIQKDFQKCAEDK